MNTVWVTHTVLVGRQFKLTVCGVLSYYLSNVTEVVMDKPGPSAPPLLTTTLDLSMEDVRHTAQEVAAIPQDMPTSNPLTSTQATTSDTASGRCLGRQ